MSSIKEPACYDVSHYNIIKDFTAIRPRPALVICKATEGVAVVDNTFMSYMAGAAAIGAHRGAYHFFRKAFKGLDQARHFCRILDGHVDERTLLILDVEEEGVNPSEMWKFFETVRTFYPVNRLMLYSRAELLNRIALTEGEKQYFRRIPIWTAGYPADPDKIPSVPDYYVPDPTKWGCVYLWQYSESGVVDGIKGEVDCDWISPTLQVMLDVEIPQEDDMSITAEQWNQLLTRLDGIANAIKDLSAGTTPGGGDGPGAPVESVYKVIERDANPNGMVVFYKTPDINETNVDRVPVKPEQQIHVINRWQDVPGLVGWNSMSDIDKQNTYIDWVCVHEKQIKNANGKFRAFPDIFLQGGSARAEYCWMLRSCLGAKVS